MAKKPTKAKKQPAPKPLKFACGMAESAVRRKVDELARAHYSGTMHYPWKPEFTKRVMEAVQSCNDGAAIDRVAKDMATAEFGRIW